MAISPLPGLGSTVRAPPGCVSEALKIYFFIIFSYVLLNDVSCCIHNEVTSSIS